LISKTAYTGSCYTNVAESHNERFKRTNTWYHSQVLCIHFNTHGIEHNFIQSYSLAQICSMHTRQQLAVF